MKECWYYVILLAALRPPQTAQTQTYSQLPLSDNSVASNLTVQQESCIEHSASTCCQLHSNVYVLSLI